MRSPRLTCIKWCDSMLLLWHDWLANTLCTKLPQAGVLGAAARGVMRARVKGVRMWWRRKRRTASTSVSSDSSSPSRAGAGTSGGRFRWIRGRRYVEGTVYIGPKDASADQFLDFQHYLVR